MADSTVSDVTKMKVVDLRKELKSRGLSYTGDKAELVERLQAAMSQDDHGDITLDSDEIDSDDVLDEDDKINNDILDDDVTVSLNEEFALTEQPLPAPAPSPPPAPATEPVNDSKPLSRTLKRKITMSKIPKDKSEEDSTENKESGSKKIVLNRAFSASSIISKPSEEITEEKPAPTTESSDSNKVRITADLDTKTKMEMRAKRFGLPVKMSDDERKEARKQRFGQNASSVLSSSTITSGTLTENIDKLKQRAERFGQSVSKIMTDIEKKEKLEKRKAKFGLVK